jgi:hypothetical protein
MKYVINTRGGAKQVDEHLLPSLLSAGCVEITQKQFEASKYYPEYDRGDQHQVTSAITPQLQVSENKTQPSRETFQTRIV